MIIYALLLPTLRERRLTNSPFRSQKPRQDRPIIDILLIQHERQSLAVGHGGALVESIAFNRRVVGSTPALAAPYRDLVQFLYLQLPVRFGVKLRYSIRAVVGSAAE